MRKTSRIIIVIIIALVLLGVIYCFLVRRPSPPSDVTLAPIDVDPNATREEMLAWIAKLAYQDANILQDMEDAAQQPRNCYTGERVELWDSKTVLGKVAEWKIAQLKDEAMKELVRKEYQEALAHIERMWDEWEDGGSGAPEFSGTAVVDLVQRLISLWILPDDEYKTWMDTWANARLSFQGREIPLTAGMAHVKVLKDENDKEWVEFLLKRENCFTIDGVRYALVERNDVAAVCDDLSRVYLYRLEPNGMAILIEEVVREHFAVDMKLVKENDHCLRLDWKEPGEDKKDSTWILLLQ